ncbi:hypothetical protein PC110_g13308 [Phytophthora cactorum]|uniref:Uncharacterized protein n=1 Tax=Phytophthora cactorum TaxID=29920 RepID=A0A329S0V4_9STRA|nr:hypothetical protein PC110_g13308 [Phytophthora cactorum]
MHTLTASHIDERVLLLVFSFPVFGLVIVHVSKAIEPPSFTDLL